MIMELIIISSKVSIHYCLENKQHGTVVVNIMLLTHLKTIEIYVTVTHMYRVLNKINCIVNSVVN